MATEIRLWQVEDEHPIPVPRDKVNLEARLEEWLVHDISLISSDLLVIGQQVETAHGKFIDLLALDSTGRVVILELKRDKTPRDIVAQALDYASWIQELGHEEVMEIANGFLKGESLEKAFKDRFNMDLPEVLNESHRMYIVASALDSGTERIVKYLSETHNVGINAATFAYFKRGGEEFLGRSMLLDEEQVATRAQSKSKRQRNLTLEELEERANNRGVRPVFMKVMSELRPLFSGSTRSLSNLTLVGRTESASRSAIIGVYPEASDPERGLAIMIYVKRLAQIFDLPLEEINTFLESLTSCAETWDPDTTWCFKENDVDALISLLTKS